MPRRVPLEEFGIQSKPSALKNALYPYPQFGSLLPSGSPTGKTYYNALQIKMTKRVSHGLQAGATYT